MRMHRACCSQLPLIQSLSDGSSKRFPVALAYQANAGHDVASACAAPREAKLAVAPQLVERYASPPAVPSPLAFSAGSAADGQLHASRRSSLSMSNSQDSLGELAQQQQQQQQQQQHMPGPAPEAEASGGEAQRKVVVLGIPWQTEDATLQQHFSRYGVVEEAQIMREKYTGKSRGFGFVTFASPADAYAAVTAEHHIDGRKCEAKFALPEGKVGSARTTRIFVARIPSSVADQQFRHYFEQFGVVQDAYMPKDPSKQGHRGIGFVTYATPESVEAVMQTTHVLNGNEIAIDRATPKDKGPSLLPGRTYMSQPNLQLASIGSSQHSSLAGGGAPMSGSGSAHGGSFGGRRPGLPASPPRFSEAMLGMGGRRIGNSALLNPGSMASPQSATAPELAAAAAAMGPGCPPGLGGLPSYGSNVSLNLLAQAQAAALQQQLSSGSMGGLEGTSPSGQLLSLLSAGAGAAGAHGGSGLYGPGPLRPNGSLSQLSPSADSSHNDLVGLLGQHLPGAGGSNGGSLRGGGGHGHGGPASLGPPSARAGPRIFVGKLNKETTEQDVKEYFIRFGYVMDVYLPRDKNNKREHRGFGFVTFETESAIQRVVAHGPHQIRGSIVAIDSAVPRQEELVLAVDHSAATATAMGAMLPPMPRHSPDEDSMHHAMDLLSLDGSNHSRHGGGLHLGGQPF